MTDYGHELQFGVFAMPSAQDPDQVVALAQAAEAAGLDLVTYQDHPYNPGFLDVYALMSFVAARTERIRLAANVTNLPLRPPAVLAKMGASIDLLSGGRFEMGLGAGGFGDAIKSMGGPDRTTGERVTALGEAIDIMRGIWTGSGQMFKHKGKQYDIPGVRAGPAPTHDIGIWLGAYKPRMLALTGAKADGWLPSYDYIKEPGITESNRLIDEAARAAGRDPREIRRLLNLGRVSLAATNGGFLNGPASQWVEELTALALEHGFSTFIVASEDPDLFKTLGQEIAPAVRAAVAKARAANPALLAPLGRRAAARAQRAPGIDYDAVPATLAKDAIEPGDRLYGSVRHTYLWSGSPGIVLRPGSAEEVAEAVLFTRRQNVPLAIRSGGHGISGRSTNDGGVVIDLRKLDTITVLDRARRRVRIGPGARWGQVAEALAPHGLAISSGDYGDVGVGGLGTSGGLGFLARKHGLTIDHLVAAEIVLADGRIVRTDAEHEPDLFWAIRGAGANFGVVTAFEFEAAELGNVIRAIQVFDASDAGALVQNWGRLVEAAPREITSFLYLFPGQRNPMAQAVSVYAGDDVDAAAEALTPLGSAGPLVQQQAHIAPYPALIPWQGGPQGGGGSLSGRSGLVDHITPEIGAAVAEVLSSRASSMLQFRAVGGAVNDLSADATAYAHRTQNFSFNAAATPDTEMRLNAIWARLRPHLNGMYFNFETHPDPDRLREAFPAATLARLRSLKRRYDEHNVFSSNFNIVPTDDAKVA
ncbi:LLM class flavin-dependent oxidoreductase [Devosia sediminis]|uniref:LLM class flavin-dependent oxidoreductase n=1 Tax=Devosia sediminis TaxID=2798801 RepID=A0A934IWG9_9HYPH|nr:LLM class flavin-dependent oxidoreductase [Devosia sediminis]MBJ3783194.1 LLM class flavin-dependent oxidoreductase [Devosia sediminis]